MGWEVDEACELWYLSCFGFVNVTVCGNERKMLVQAQSALFKERKRRKTVLPLEF